MRRPLKVVRATKTDLRPSVRTCVGCRTRRARAELHRCALTAAGRAVVDRSAAGRGAWLCGPQCLETALTRRAFDRAWRTVAPAGVAEDLRAAFARMDDRSMDAGEMTDRSDEGPVRSRATMTMRMTKG